MKEIIVELPAPISTNRIWRANKAGKLAVSISPEYASWRRAADNLSMLLGQLRGVKRIDGPFEAHIIVKRKHGDLDNQIKGVLDWIESRGLIESDKNCERLIVEWGDAARGARVILREMERT